MQALLVKHEGLRLKPYTDTVGKLTIGVGRNLTDVGITVDEAMALLQNDMETADAALRIAWPPYLLLDQARAAVILDMAFNMGVTTLMTFHNTLAAVAAGNWAAASAGMLASRWASQVGPRAQELAQIMVSGVW
jgi:lysozyme